MEITEVRVYLTSDTSDGLMACVSVVLDGCFLIKDIKVILSRDGHYLIVAMPYRSLMDRCESCNGRNNVLARYCCWCGDDLPDNRAKKRDNGKSLLYSDIAHPVTKECRELFRTAILKEYHRMKERGECEEAKEECEKEID